MASNDVQDQRIMKSWRLRTVITASVFIAVILGWGISTFSNESMLSSVRQQREQLSQEVQDLQSQMNSITKCKTAMGNLQTATDHYWAAYVAWTDQFEKMANNGILAGDWEALIAIPDEMDSGDTDIDRAKSAGCY